MNKEQVMIEKEKPSGFVLKPIENLKGFEFDNSDAFVCDMETGVCGPANKERESK